MSKQIDGFKFHDDQLDFLKHIAKNNKLTASATTMFLLLQSKCDYMGRVNKKSLDLPRLSADIEIPYSTLHTGLQDLMTSGHVSLKLVEKEHSFVSGYFERTDYYVLTNYSEYDEEGNLKPYFQVPNKLFKTPILKQLITSKNVEGILFLLELFKRFSHAPNVSNAQYKYFLSSIVDGIEEFTTKTKKTIRKNVNQAIALMQGFITFSKGKGKKLDRKLRRDMRKGITTNPGIDMRHSFFEFKVEDELLHEQTEYKYSQILYKAGSEIKVILDDNSFSYTDEDIAGVLNVLRHDVVDVLATSLDVTALAFDAPLYARMCAEDYVRSVKKSNVSNPIGYIRGIIRSNFKGYIESTITPKRQVKLIDILFNYFSKTGLYPESIK